MKLSEEIKWRGLIHSVTDEELYDLLDNSKVKFYLGIDATAPSIHIGTLACLMFVNLLQKYGHEGYILLGGATTRVGDPKETTEREMSQENTIEYNQKCIEEVVKRIVDCKIVNNYDWFKNINYLDFLRDVGKYINVAYMINKDVVKRRLETGISYAEFSYQLIQGYDFAHLYKEYGVSLQMGGQDQWGNITSGVEFVRKSGKYEDANIYGLTTPLVLKSDGTKYGKTESGSIWLTKEDTKVYDFYQYFVNIPDDSALMFLKRFTLLSKEEIEGVYEEFLKAPHNRLAQKTTAYEITKLVHGEEEANSAVRISEALFTSDLSELSNEEINDGFGEVYVNCIESEETILDVLINNNLVQSKREGREFICNGAISVNGVKYTDPEMCIDFNSAINNKYFLLKRGKKKYYLFDRRDN